MEISASVRAVLDSSVAKLSIGISLEAMNPLPPTESVLSPCQLMKVSWFSVTFSTQKISPPDWSTKSSKILIARFASASSPKKQEAKETPPY